jgi:hypothetical protein
MEMILWELAIHLNILNISKDCQRMCSDFSLQPAVGIPNRSRLGTQIIALKHTKMEGTICIFCTIFYSGLALVWRGHNW